MGQGSAVYCDHANARVQAGSSTDGKGAYTRKGGTCRGAALSRNQLLSAQSVTQCSLSLSCRAGELSEPVPFEWPLELWPLEPLPFEWPVPFEWPLDPLP